jgi:chemotaxis protein methyltransferase CheR
MIDRHQEDFVNNETTEFMALQRTIERLVNIRCTQYKEDYIKRRVLSRMRVTMKESYREYHTFLLSSPKEVEDLKNALTINVTSFFRDPEVFGIVGREIFPALIRRKKRLHIWCAGCSSGEEPYTLAILFHELFAQHPDISGVIYATDIDDEVLSRARKGIYNENALENMRSSQIKKHFTPQGEGLYEVKPHLREIIRFRHHDLMSGIPVARFLDCITCRNVTIYFTEGQKNDLVRMFYSALALGGFYVTGKTEYLGREVEHLFSPYHAEGKIYVKKD